MSQRPEALPGGMDMDEEKTSPAAPYLVDTILYGGHTPSAPTDFQVLFPGSLNVARDHPWEGRLLIPEGLIPQPVQRLLVLVPEDDFDENRLSQRLWNIASPSALAVSLVGMYSLPATEPLLRRRLASIAGNTRNRNVNVQTKIVPGKNWIKAIEGALRPGDLVVCLEEHKITNWGVLNRPVGMALSTSLHVPVYTISGIPIEPTSPVASWVKEAVVWMAAIGIMAAFAWMQLMIDRAYQGWQSILLTMITIVFEVWMLWKLSESTS